MMAQGEGLWILLIIFPLFGLWPFWAFHAAHRLFMALKSVDPDYWEQLGRPWCKLSIPMKWEKLSVPHRTVWLTHLWLARMPDWAKDSELGRAAIIKYRLSIAPLPLLVALGLWVFFNLVP